MSSIAFSPTFRNNPFHDISRAFLDDPSLAFAKVLPLDVVEGVFRKYESFREVGFYSTGIVVLAFVLQVLSDGKLATASAAVSRIAAYFMSKGHPIPSSNTGDYCNARKQLDPRAIQELALLVAKNVEFVASSTWLWKEKHHVLLMFRIVYKVHDVLCKVYPNRYKTRFYGVFFGQCSLYLFSGFLIP